MLAAALGASACEPEPEPLPEPSGPVSLASATAWEWVGEVDRDAFGAERPADAICDPTLGITIEDFGSERVLEISTDLCNYATVQQPSLAPIAVGDTVSLRAWHYELVAPTPAQAHLALAIDGELVWEQAVPMPSAAAMVEHELVATSDWPLGSDLQFHVHNHGSNSYDLLSLQVTAADEAEAR